MARRRDTLCAGGCGSLLWSGSSSLPVGQRMCQPCRRSRAPQRGMGPRSRVASCPVCSVLFETVVHNKVFCSEKCRGWRKPTTQGPRSKGRTGRPWRRLRSLVQLTEPNCWLCGLEIDADRGYPDPWSFSVDHVVPLSLGGAPLERGNARAAHLRCNMRRRRNRRLARQGAVA